MVTFNDKNIHAIFGVENSENKKPELLKEYFFRNRAYENLTLDLPIRILVGHKGVGKSALLKIAFLEDEEEGTLAVWIRPNDIDGIASNTSANLNTLIEEWKIEITNIVASRIAEHFSDNKRILQHDALRGTVRHLTQAVINIIESAYEKPFNEISERTAECFRKSKVIRVYLDDVDRGSEA
jgi:hypothetical protein